jgi:YfiH family protein
MWLKATNIKCAHGFSTRRGGVSPPPFDSLNLGGSEDIQSNILANRLRALQYFRFNPSNLSLLKQVHGNKVCLAQRGRQEGDALVTDQKGLILAVSIADCYPILFCDETNGVIGAAHAGWRGTCAMIAGEVVGKMLQMGAEIESIQVAIGQGISRDKFEVGDEVLRKFEDAGFPDTCRDNNKIDLVRANEFVLERSGILKKNIWKMNRCTFEADFFSYRRDKGVTGRMWGLIALD